MHRDVFSENGAVTNAAIADAAGEGSILRHISDDCSGVNLAIAADVCVSEDLHERPQR